MAETLFGEKLILEDQIVLVYSGDHFDDGIPINSLINQLVALEKLARITISEYLNRGLIDSDIPEYQILIRIETGSVKETLKVTFKNPWTYAILSMFVAPMLNTTYEKALDVLIPDKENAPVVDEIIKNNQQLRNYCSEILEPITTFGGNLTITSNDKQSVYDKQQAELIRSFLDKYEDSDETEPLKNGEFKESKMGVIRKTNLDEKSGNYFGFNIEGGEKGVPMSIEGEFNFNDYRNLIDRPVLVTGIFRYKNEKITHIKLEKYESIETVTQLSIESAKLSVDEE